MVDRKVVLLCVLVTTGVIFAVLLTVLTFMIWRHLQNKKRKENGLLAEEDENLDILTPRIFEPKNPVPIITCQTVLGQDSLYGNPREEYSLNHLHPDPPSRRISVEWINDGPTQMYPSRTIQHADSLASIQSECDEDFLHNSPPISEDDDPLHRQCFERTKSPLSLSNTKSQINRKRSRKAIDLRGNSITEDMFLDTIGRIGGGRKSMEKLVMARTSIVTPKERERRTYAELVPPLHLKDQPIMGGLEPKGIYKRDDGDQPKGLYKRGGKIIFKTQYCKTKKELEIHILKAFDLASNREMTEITPFVRVYLLPGKKQKQDTKYKKQPTKEPFFNEKIIFQGLKKEDLLSQRLKIKVCNHSRVKGKEILGEAELTLSSIDFDREKSFCMTLFQQRYEIKSASISISVCHEATESKLVAVIHEAHLPKASKTMMNPNPYVTLVLYKDEHSISRKQTSSKRMTANPFYDERFEFPIFTTTADDLGKYALDVSLKHNSYVGKGNTFGHVMLSLNSSQKTAEEQWKGLIELPHKYHKSVHALIDPSEL